MFYFLITFKNKNLIYKNVNKFKICDLNSLFKIKKIILQYKFKKCDLNLLSIHSLILEYLSENKKLTFINSKKSNILLKIKKGNPIGCEICLKNSKFVLVLIKNLILDILLLIKQNQIIKKNCSDNFFILKLNNIVLISKLEKFFNLLVSTNEKINIIFITNQKKIRNSYFFYNLKFFR